MSGIKKEYLDVSDSELVSFCQKELPYKTKSYEALILRYEPLVYQFCLRYLRNEADAEEVVQDIFLRVFHYLKRFEGRSSFKTWLMKIAQNQCSRKYNQLKLRKEKEDYFSHDQGQLNPGPITGNEKSNTGFALTVLDELSENDRAILSLRHLAGLTLSEVAKILDISDSAAKMRHQRAISRFKALFYQRGGKM